MRLTRPRKALPPAALVNKRHHLQGAAVRRSQHTAFHTAVAT